MLHSPIPPDPGGEGLTQNDQRVQSQQEEKGEKSVTKVVQEPTPNLVEMLQLWILICFHYIAFYLHRLGDAKKLEKHLQLKAIEQKEADIEIIDTEKADEEFYFPTTLNFRPSRPVSLVVEDLELAIPDVKKILHGSVSQTSYITTIFEANKFGLSKLTSDVMEELNLWFARNGLLAIACEMVWNVPMKYRDRSVESQLKDGLFKFLRANNRRVLDMKWKDKSLPLTFPDATTQEKSGQEQQNDAFQGVYRRFYGDLLPYQHKETASVHAPFWSLKQDELHPNPEQFLLGNGRKFSELGNTTLVALNLLTLKVRKE